MAEKEYVKLTPLRRQTGFAVISTTRSNLWLGKDHLLCVETEGYSEKYKRFYFRDIQAVVLNRTNRFVVIGLVTGALTFVFGLLALVTDDLAGKWVLGIITAVIGVPFLLNLLYGPTCKCQLRTAVQTEDQPSISRVRRARKVFNRIRPLIAEAQGQLTPEEIPLRFQQLVAPAGSAPPVMQSADATPPIAT